jgi:ketosteroid isomerase-like protein
MSEENMEVVRRALDITLEAVRRGDPGAAFDECLRDGLIASDLAWRAGFRGGVGVAGIRDFAGREGFVEFMRAWTEDFDDFAIEAEEIIDVDSDRVLAITRQHGIGKVSRATVEMSISVIYTLEGRRIMQVEVFLEPSHALDAAGLELRRSDTGATGYGPRRVPLPWYRLDWKLRSWWGRWQFERDFRKDEKEFERNLRKDDKEERR